MKHDPQQRPANTNSLDYTAVRLSNWAWHLTQQLIFSTLVLLFSLCAGAASPALKLGMSAPLTGAAASLGQDYQAGAMLVFDRVNQQGGIAGRPLQLICLDDGYEPLRTVANTKSLLFEHEVTALFGFIGTPTSNAVLPMLRLRKTPYLAAFTGADLLRQSHDEFIYNFRASYVQEAEAQIRYLVDQQKYRRVALLIQADEFGATLEQHFRQQLQQRGITPVVTSRFARNTKDVSHVVNDLIKAKPELVLTVGTYQVLSAVINSTAEQGFNPLYSVVSFSGVSKLSQLLPTFGRVIASMVVPDPISDQSAFTQTYRTAAQAAGQQPNEIGLEAFAAATLLVQALQSCATDLNSACILQQLPRQQLFDFPLHYDPKRHQASQQIFLVHVGQRQLQPITLPVLTQ
jgi:ABC-type branched-subunit amino acid transport system substrate-binding protein